MKERSKVCNVLCSESMEIQKKGSKVGIGKGEIASERKLREKVKDYGYG